MGIGFWRLTAPGDVVCVRMAAQYTRQNHDVEVAAGCKPRGQRGGGAEGERGGVEPADPHTNVLDCV